MPWGYCGDSVVVGVKKRERKALGRYIRSVADEMGLRDWTLHLLREPCDEDCNAQTHMVYGRRTAHIRVSEGFRDREPEGIRQTVVHELTHLHFAAATSQAELDLEGHLGAQAHGVFWNGWQRNFEYGIDATAVALAPHMPLIDWDDEG